MISPPSDTRIIFLLTLISRSPCCSGRIRPVQVEGMNGVEIDTFKRSSVIDRPCQATLQDFTEQRREKVFG
jgi:hypothetical protein